MLGVETILMPGIVAVTGFSIAVEAKLLVGSLVAWADMRDKALMTMNLRLFPLFNGLV